MRYLEQISLINLFLCHSMLDGKIKMFNNSEYNVDDNDKFV